MSQPLTMPTLLDRNRAMSHAAPNVLGARKAALSLAKASKRIRKLGPLPTPYDCGAQGGGADDSGPLQAWADLAGPLLLPAPFRHDTGLVWSSGTTVLGFGVGGLYCPNPDIIHHTHRSYVFPGDENRVDRDITFDRVRFRSDPDAIPAAIAQPLVFIGVDGLGFPGCTFSGYRNHVLVLSNNRRVNLDRVEVSDWGDRRPYTGPPGGWFGGCAIWMLTGNFDVSGHDIQLRGGYGIGIWADINGRNHNLTGIVIDGCAEAGLVGFPPGSNFEITSVRSIPRVDVSGHAVESQERDWSLAVGRIEGVDGAGVYVTDPTNVVIHTGTIDRCNRVYDQHTGCIIVRTLDADPLRATNNLTLSNIGMAASDGNGAHAMSHVNFSGNPLSLQRAVRWNALNTGAPSQWRTGAYGFLPTDTSGSPSLVMGADCFQT